MINAMVDLVVLRLQVIKNCKSLFGFSWLWRFYIDIRLQRWKSDNDLQKSVKGCDCNQQYQVEFETLNIPICQKDEGECTFAST